ncbi:penicillin acylase family protein [Kitasatospora sp. HPMI-4]|uniref:penicillin acylase family protein n=1 Tax=Kitasatospora sp. HPMI-4 TaxID=3448443 RepID=UPI003F1E1F8D
MAETRKPTWRQRSTPLGRLASGMAALCLTSVTAALLPASASAAAPDTGSLHDHGYTAQIGRTEYGIPHIQAQDYGSLGYGYGYAFAQDNLCQLADQVVTLRGERSRYLDPSARASDGTPNLASDTYYQGLRRAGTVQRLLDRPAPLGPTAELRRMVEGYAAGYNRYLRDTGVAKLPDPTCRGKAWVGPITALDLWSLVYDINGNAGAEGFKQSIATATPPAAGGPAEPSALTAPAAGAPAVPAAPVAPTGSAVPAKVDLGSNGWALGRDVTRGHDSMLLANPHLPWIGSHRFYQVQLTIPGELDVSGAGLYGTPLVEIGHTRNLAWTHTTSYADHASLYRLSLVPGDPTGYLVDGKAERMGRQTVPVTVRGADGRLSTVTRTLYTSRYGPVLADQWTGTNAYAIRDVNADNLRSMNEWLAMDRSQSLAQLQQAHRTYQGVPWTYTIATDTSGTTYFTDSSTVPNVTDAQLKRCALPAVHDEPGILDGSTSACDLGSDPDAIVPGIFGPANQPKLTRTDYVANSNNDSYLANLDAPITGYPSMYDGGRELGLRPQLGLRMIAERRNGTDGLGAPGFTLPTLQATMLGDRDYGAELGRDDAVAMCRANPDPTATDGTRVDVRSACDILAAWDTRVDPDSRGAVLWQRFQQGLFGIGHSWWRVPYDPAQPLTTPRGINGDDAKVQGALADAVQGLTAQKIPLDAAMGSVQRWAGVPLPGCSGGLGCFNAVQATPTSGSGGGTQAGPGDSAYGSSFVMATELTPQGPRTRTILTYGESADPTSPHYTDQTVLFSHKQWVTERFTDAEIKADPQLRTTVLHG